MVRSEAMSDRDRAEETWLAMATPDPAFFLAEANEGEMGQEAEPRDRRVVGGARRAIPYRED